jgi:hypothetical protein
MYEEYHACHSCLNRRVSVYTVYGEVHEGVIVSVDQQNVYLDTSKTSAFGLGFGGRQTILTLALFDLLAIALIA